MTRLLDQMTNLIRKYGLAVACMILPWTTPTAWTVPPFFPWGTGDISIEYTLDSRQPAVAARSTPTPHASIEPVVPNALFVSHLTGRIIYAQALGYAYVLCGVVFVFSGIVILNHIGWVGLFAGILVYGSFAYFLIYFSVHLGPAETGLSLLVDRILEEADSTKWGLKSLALAGGTGKKTIFMVRLALGTAILSVGVLSLAVGLASIRASEAGLNVGSLKRRLWVLRLALVLSSLLLVNNVVALRLLLDWSVGLLAKDQAGILSPLANTFVSAVAASNTLKLVGTFLPAVAAYLLDVHRYRSSQVSDPNTGDATIKAGHATKSGVINDDGLSLAPLPTVAGVIAILGPLLTSPVIDAVRSLLQLSGAN